MRANCELELNEGMRVGCINSTFLYVMGTTNLSLRFLLPACLDCMFSEVLLRGKTNAKF